MEKRSFEWILIGWDTLEDCRTKARFTIILKATKPEILTFLKHQSQIYQYFKSTDKARFTNILKATNGKKELWVNPYYIGWDTLEDCRTKARFTNILKAPKPDLPIILKAPKPDLPIFLKVPKPDLLIF